MKFERYSNGNEYTTVRVSYRLTRADLARALAISLERTNMLEDLPDLMTRLRVEMEIRSALMNNGLDGLMDGPTGDDSDAWLDWAERQIARYWP